MRYSKYLILGAMMAAGTAQAANTAINVQGKITPPACNAEMSVGADLNWGDIPHSTLNANDMTVLDAKTATLKVTCEPETKTSIAFWVTDANSASALVGKKIGTGGNNGNDANRIFGIGFDPVTTKKLGNFTLIGKTSSFDGTENSTNFGYIDNGSAHNATNFAVMPFSQGWGMGLPQEWTVLDTTSKPASASDFTFTFDVVPQLNKKSEITNAQEVPFAGTAQFFVRYF